MKIPRQWIHPKMWWQHWKLFHNRSSKNVSSNAALLGQVHSCWRGVLHMWSLSVRCKYRGMLAIKSFQDLHSYSYTYTYTL
jgi:hypothetical protein